MATILLVEDEEDLAEICQEIFEANGFKVTKANDGQEALTLLARSSFDIVFSDSNMPNLGGLGLLEAIFAKDYRCKLFYLATGDSEITDEKVSFLGGTSVVPKPYDLDTVVELFNKALKGL